jgi:hypothetical protein
MQQELVDPDSRSNSAAAGAPGIQLDEVQRSDAPFKGLFFIIAGDASDWGKEWIKQAPIKNTIL